MIAPFSWLWKQLQGPQISAISHAIFTYMQTSFNSILEYWNGFNIHTATNAHLTTIGALQGIARPIITLAHTKYFWFSEVPAEGTYYPSIPYETSEHGLSALENMEVGGKFSEVAGNTDDVNTQLSEALFRQLLINTQASASVPGSLGWLDLVLNTLWSAYHPTETPAYTIKILNTEDVQGTSRMVGDVQIYLGSEEAWGDTALAQAVAVINLLGRTIYYPNPTVFVSAGI